MRTSFEEALAMLNLFYGAGYRRFKLVNQARQAAVRSNVTLNLSVRLASRAARRLLPVGTVSNVAPKLTRSSSLPVRFRLIPGWTGPRDEDVAGAWMSFDLARAV